jgi:hypothetical protein
LLLARMVFAEPFISDQGLVNELVFEKVEVLV